MEGLLGEDLVCDALSGREPVEFLQNRGDELPGLGVA